MIIGVYIGSTESPTERKLYFHYSFRISHEDELKYEDELKNFRPRFAPHRSGGGWTNALEYYYGPVANICFNADGGYIVQNTSLITEDFISLPFNELFLYPAAADSEALKKQPNKFPHFGNSPEMTDISDIKLNSLTLLLGIYDMFFPNVWPYKNISFEIEWNNKNIILDLGWMHTFLTSIDARKVKSDTNDFLNALVLQYIIQPAFITHEQWYKDSPYILSISREIFIQASSSPNQFLLSTIPEDYYTEYAQQEFNENCSFVYEEILGSPTFIFAILSVRIPKLLLRLIPDKLACYIAFHLFHQQYYENSSYEDQLDEIRNEERMEDNDFDPKEFYEDPFEDAPGWQWNID